MEKTKPKIFYDENRLYRGYDDCKVEPHSIVVAYRSPASSWSGIQIVKKPSAERSG